MSIINDIDLANVKIIKNETNSATFIFEPLFPGYGVTIGHALRRVLLSSLQGSAITNVKIDGTTHEFTTIKGVREDVMDIILNLKHLVIKSYSDEPVVLKLQKKGPGKVTAEDFVKNSQIEILDPGQYIATLEKDGKLNLQVTVEKGFGYVPIEKREEKTKTEIGNIAIDAIYNPVKKINYQVENTRVGSATDYNKLILNITTNGTITPEEALKLAIEILTNYLAKLIPSVPTEKKVLAKKAKIQKKVVKTKSKSKKK